MDLSKNNNETTIAYSEENQALIKNNDRCDKYDYLIAVTCGTIGSLVDVFLVGSPAESKLSKWADDQIDNSVKAFAKLCGWSPRAEKSDSVASAIGFLEKKFKVNYDQRHSADVNNQFVMSTKNHHMKSLAHSPDIIGLFFSILNQFTSTSTFISEGRMITINTENFELMGTNVISKLFCGVVNWLGHIMSDIAGSSGSRGNSGRGTGIVIPFYELFGFCKFGKFNVGSDKQDLATIAIRAFQEGYDFRFGLAMAIPVIITDLSIRLIWSLRRRFQYGKPLRECIPTQEHPDLRIMILCGNASLCIIDGVDAGLRSGANFLAFFMRLNLIAWFRLVVLVLKELYIRLGLPASLQEHLDSYKRINEALLSYLRELKQIDIEAFKRETEEYNYIIDRFREVKNGQELNDILLDVFKKMEFNKPWKGDFEEHMLNKNARLIFE